VSQPFVFEKLQFEFGPSWHAVGWDRDKAYTQGIHRLNHEGAGTKAVDCLAVHPEFGVCFLEVTDGRGDVHFAKTIDSKGVFAEVGFKVRDTLAGLVGTLSHEGSNADKWAPFRKPLQDGQFSVVLWIEHDAPAQAQEAELSFWTDTLRKYVRWLTQRRVIVTNLRLGTKGLLPDLTVTNLKGAGQIAR
jgi:hypothetical protein